MKQVSKFYLSSFLKNQTYFTPIMILFLQFHKLSYSEIFWVYTIAAISNIVLEIPTGVISDLFGKRKTMIFSRAFTLIAFLIFGFSDSFWQFVIAQLFISLGESFKSGTDVAYIFDYLEQSKSKIGYTEVKGKQKFWARIGEAIATSIGGFIAKFLGYNAVFLIASVPAMLHFLLMFRFEKIKEINIKKEYFKESFRHINDAFKEIFSNRYLIVLMINISLYVVIMKGSEKFIQPYMQEVGIGIEYFGLIYAILFVLTAFAVRYSYLIEKRFSKIKIINFITFVSVLPLVILGFGYVSIIGVVLFFLIIIGENIRSPIDNHEFNQNIKSKHRATLGSILMLTRNIGLALFLPLFGFVADNYSMYLTLLIMAGLMLVNGVVFRVKQV